MSDDNTTSHDRSHPHDGGERPRFNGRRPKLTSWFLLMVTVLVVVAVGFIGVVLGHSRNTTSATVTVTGSGTVQGTPDTINFQIGVHTVSATATAALAQNTAKVYALEAALRSDGVTNKQMQTANLNIYENSDNSGHVTGFSVEDSLNITMHNTNRAGAAIDAAAHAVGNGIVLNGVSFSITNQSKLLAGARSRAMKNARLAAGELASAGGTHVTTIVRVTDQENQGMSNFYSLPASTASFKAAVPIQAGSQPITVQVTVVYSLSS